MQSTNDTLVGGESARLILETLRSFPVAVGPDGRMKFEDTSQGDVRDMLDRALAVVELEALTRCHRQCPPGAHRTMDEAEYRLMMLLELGARAKAALGEGDVVEVFW